MLKKMTGIALVLAALLSTAATSWAAPRNIPMPDPVKEANKKLKNPNLKPVPIPRVFPSPHIKFSGSIWASTWDWSEPIGNTGAFAYQFLGQIAPGGGDATEIGGFRTLENTPVDDVSFTFGNFTLNNDETQEAAGNDQCNFRYHEVWEGGRGAIVVNGQEVAFADNLRLVADSQIWNQCNWTNEITEAYVEGQLQAVPGSALGQAIVNEYSRWYRDTNFHIYFTPTARYQDLRIREQTVSPGWQSLYHFDAVLAR